MKVDKYPAVGQACTLNDWHVKQRESFLQPKTEPVDIPTLGENDCAAPLFFAGQFAACLLPGESEETRRVLSGRIIDAMRKDVSEGRLRLRHPETGQFALQVNVEETTWLLLYAVKKADFLAWAPSAGFSIPPAFVDRGAVNDTTVTGRLPIEQVKELAKDIAQTIGDRKWATGIRAISAHNIAGAVSQELAKDTRTWGKQGARSDHNVRTVLLKGWRYKRADGC